MNAQWQETQQRKDTQRLKEISQLDSRLINKAELFEQVMTELTPDNNGALALTLLDAMKNRLKLTDLDIAVMETTDESLANACAYLELAREQEEAEKNNKHINELQLTEHFATRIINDLKKHETQLTKVTHPYLLLLGKNTQLNENFDYKKLNKIVYSGVEHKAKLSPEKQAEFTNLGFRIDQYAENGVYQLIVELSQPKKEMWVYFLEWWLDQVVVLGKPITYYNSTFYMPLDKPTTAEGEAKFPIVTPQYQYELKENFHPQKFSDLPEDAPQKEKDTQKIEKERQDQYIAEQEAWMYFLPHQRSYLFNEKAEDSNKSRGIGPNKNKIKPIQEYRLMGDHKENLLDAARKETLLWELKVRENLTVKMPVKQVYLYQYFNGLMYLAIHVENQFECGASWVEGLISGSRELREKLITYQYENCLKFTKNARVLYPAFVDAEKEGKHFAKALTLNGKTLAEDKQEDLTSIVASQKRFQASEMLSRPIRHLLCEFLSSSDHLNAESEEGNKERKRCTEIIDGYIKTLPDDRMFTSAVYSYAGNLPQSEEQVQRFHSYAHYVDDSSMKWSEFKEFAYNPDFVKEQLKANSYKRWDELGQLISFNDYNHTYIGHGGFFNNIIANKHVPYIYNRMLLSALFYRLSFEHYNREITVQTHALTNTWYAKRVFTQPFTKLKQEFIQFVNQYWFVELTQQIQGKEMFKMMIKPLESERQFEQIKSELDAANDYADGKSNHLKTVIGLFISFIGVVLAYLAIR